MSTASRDEPEPLPLAVRVWTESADGNTPRPGTVGRKRHPAQHAPERWPRGMLIFDTETTTDPTQRLTFAWYRYARWRDDGTLACVEEGIIYADDLPDRDPDG